MQVLLILCSIAAGHALFWAAYLFVLNQKWSNRLLALLLVMLALRIGKSVMGIVFPGHMYFFTTVGLISMAEVGPLLFLLVKSLFDGSFKLSGSGYLHLFPGAVMLVATITTHWSYLNISYYVFTGHLLLYIIASALFLWRSRHMFGPDDLKMKWAIYMLSGIFILWITFVLQLLFYHPLVYQLIVGSAAVIFYALSWWAIPHARLFMTNEKRKGNNQQYDELGQRIQKILVEEELFTDSTLTVSKLASRLKVPPYAVSRATNASFGKSFSEVLIHYRIQKATRLLQKDTSRLLTIEAIAYESGFNTLSAFYTSFKKVNKITPAQYRDLKINQNIKMV